MPHGKEKTESQVIRPWLIHILLIQDKLRHRAVLHFSVLLVATASLDLPAPFHYDLLRAGHTFLDFADDLSTAVRSKTRNRQMPPGYTECPTPGNNGLNNGRRLPGGGEQALLELSDTKDIILWHISLQH